MSENTSLEDENLMLKTVLESTRSKLVKATITNADLEGLLILERKKNEELVEILQKSSEKK